MNRSAVMYLSMLTMVVAFVVWSLMSPIAPQMQKLYHLTGFEKSLLVATPVLLGSILRVPLGMLTDRFGGRLVYTLLMVYLVIPLWGISTAHSFDSLIFWEVLLGIAGTSFAVGIGHVSVWYPSEQQGLVLGITALGNIGTAIAVFSIPVLYLHLGFAMTTRLLVLPVLLMAALLWFFTRDPNPADIRTHASTTATGPVATTSGDGAKTVRKEQGFWTSGSLWALAAFYFITFGGFVAFGNYLPTLLQAQFQLTPIDAGLRAAGFVVLATAMRPLGGYLADRLSPYSLLGIAFSVITLSALLFAIGLHSMSLTTVAALVCSIMLGIGNGAVFKLVPFYFPFTTGKATGIVGAIGGIGGFFPPLAMGAIQQSTGSYAGGLLLLAVASLLALLLVGWMNRHWQQGMNHAVQARF
ncbi:NarK/NasA family nitrate transporter [Alicyclobacillaceae bacterium I2511]|nr:NarK/NasA family nitrate transporter [Alicyclobacillaceae bacterium I2511]